MTEDEAAALQPLALKLLATRAGPDAGADAVATAARSAYDDLARVSVPLIGETGLNTLAGRAFHLARLMHPCLVQPHASPKPEDSFAPLATCLRQQPPIVALDAAAAVFAILAALLVAFIGEALTLQLLRQAWPDAFPGAGRSQQA